MPNQPPDITPDISRQSRILADNADRRLQEAIFAGNVVLVAALLEAGEASPHAAAPGGVTPLHQATRAHCSDVQKRAMAALLLAHGANPNVGDDHGFTPLHYAAFYGVPEMCRFLVENDAQVNIRDRRLETPLHWAVRAKDAPPVVAALLRLGASVDMRNRHKLNPVQVARDECRSPAYGVLQHFISSRHAQRVKRIGLGRQHGPILP